MTLYTAIYFSRFMLRNSMGACLLPTAPRMSRPLNPGMRGPMLYPMTFATNPCPQPQMLFSNSPIRAGGQIPSFYSPPSQHAFYEPPVNMMKRMNDQVSSFYYLACWRSEERVKNRVRLKQRVREKEKGWFKSIPLCTCTSIHFFCQL